MDLAFLLRAQRLLGDPEPAPLDYEALVATLAAHRSATALAELRASEASRKAGQGQDALVELLLAGPGWREAALAQGGCFNAAIVAVRRARE